MGNSRRGLRSLTRFPQSSRCRQLTGLSVLSLSRYSQGKCSSAGLPSSSPNFPPPPPLSVPVLNPLPKEASVCYPGPASALPPSLTSPPPSWATLAFFVTSALCACWGQGPWPPGLLLPSSSYHSGPLPDSLLHCGSLTLHTPFPLRCPFLVFTGQGFATSCVTQVAVSLGFS